MAIPLDGRQRLMIQRKSSGRARRLAKENRRLKKKIARIMAYAKSGRPSYLRQKSRTTGRTLSGW